MGCSVAMTSWRRLSRSSTSVSSSPPSIKAASSLAALSLKARIPSVAADPDGDVARIYKTIARTVAVKIAQQSKDFSSKFPTISISKGT